MATAQLPWAERDFKSAQHAQFVIAGGRGIQETPAIPSHLSEAAKDFISKCVTWDIEKRPNAGELLSHPFIRLETPASSIEADKIHRELFFERKRQEEAQQNRNMQKLLIADLGGNSDDATLVLQPELVPQQQIETAAIQVRGCDELSSQSDRPSDFIDEPAVRRHNKRYENQPPQSRQHELFDSDELMMLTQMSSLVDSGKSAESAHSNSNSTVSPESLGLPVDFLSAPFKHKFQANSIQFQKSPVPLNATESPLCVNGDSEEIHDANNQFHSSRISTRSDDIQQTANSGGGEKIFHSGEKNEKIQLFGIQNQNKEENSIIFDK